MKTTWLVRTLSLALIATPFFLSSYQSQAPTAGTSPGAVVADAIKSRIKVNPFWLLQGDKQD